MTVMCEQLILEHKHETVIQGTAYTVFNSVDIALLGGMVCGIRISKDTEE